MSPSILTLLPTLSSESSDLEKPHGTVRLANLFKVTRARSECHRCLLRDMGMSQGPAIWQLGIMVINKAND